jgi:hypothetical protein
MRAKVFRNYGMRLRMGEEHMGEDGADKTKCGQIKRETIPTPGLQQKYVKQHRSQTTRENIEKCAVMRIAGQNRVQREQHARSGGNFGIRLQQVRK